MKNRNILFGYHYKNGVIAIHPDESETVKRIFNSYLGGDSLLTIAEKLNGEKIEYMPGVIGWNKARLKRLIEDERYIGSNTYPALINEKIHNDLQKTRAERNTQKHTDRKSDIFRIDVPVTCPDCKDAMSRRHDSRMKIPDRWTCKNRDCRCVISIPDTVLLQRITAVLNTVIDNPGIIRCVKAPSVEPSLATRRLENEISRTLESFGFNKEDLRKKLLECVSLKYDDLDTTQHITEMLRAEFENSSPLSIFSAEFLGKTVGSIELHTDGGVSIILLNGQEIGKEHNDDSNNSHTEKEGNIYTSEGIGAKDSQQQIRAASGCGILQSINSSGRTAQQL